MMSVFDPIQPDHTGLEVTKLNREISENVYRKVRVWWAPIDPRTSSKYY
jgi:hypothetical protein